VRAVLAVTHNITNISATYHHIKDGKTFILACSEHTKHAAHERGAHEAASGCAEEHLLLNDSLHKMNQQLAVHLREKTTRIRERERGRRKERRRRSDERKK
jgi:hypothetical protein